jgi:hypothetical protein
VHIGVSSSVGAVEASPLEGDKQSQHRQRGRSTSIIEGGVMHHPHKIPSSRLKDHERKEGEGCAGDRDSWDPTQYQFEATHTISLAPKRKRNSEGGVSIDPDDLELNTTDMEIDEENNNTPIWVVV